MPLFPSDDWIDEFCRRVRTHPAADGMAAELDGVYRFVVEPAGPLTETRAYDIAIRPGDGAPVVEPVAGAGSAPPRVVLTADYRRWREMITGELDVGLAVMLRRLRVSGDVAQLMGRISTVRPLAQSLSAVETQWLDS